MDDELAAPAQAIVPTLAPMTEPPCGSNPRTNSEGWPHGSTVVTDTLAFQPQPDGKLGVKWNGWRVVLAREHERSPQVQAGVPWVVTLRLALNVLIAEPIHELNQAETSEHQKRVHRTNAPMMIGGNIMEPTDIISPGERVAFIVDAANIAGSAEALGFKIDWALAVDYFLGKGMFAGASYHIVEHAHTPYSKTYDWLAGAGFVIHRKRLQPTRELAPSPRTSRASLDVEITIDMLSTCSAWDSAYLFTGNGNFSHLIEALRVRGKRVFVVSSARDMSRELWHVANKPVYHLENHRSMIERTSTTPP